MKQVLLEVEKSAHRARRCLPGGITAPPVANVKTKALPLPAGRRDKSGNFRNSRLLTRDVNETKVPHKRKVHQRAKHTVGGLNYRYGNILIIVKPYNRILYTIV